MRASRVRFSLTPRRATGYDNNVLKGIHGVQLDLPRGDTPSGYSHTFRYGSRLVHVQTEDVGQPRPHALTQIFCEGATILSRRISYRRTDSAATVAGLLQASHREMCRALARGQLERLIDRHVRSTRSLAMLEHLQREVPGFQVAAIVDRCSGPVQVVGSFAISGAQIELTALFERTASALTDIGHEAAPGEMLFRLQQHLVILHPVDAERFLLVIADRVEGGEGVARWVTAKSADALA